jgi:hypothetical protein
VLIVSKATYITGARLRTIVSSLTDRDQALIRDVDRLGLVSGAQLRQLHFADTPSGRRLARLHLLRLVELRVLQRLGRRAGGVRAGSDGFVYSLDVAGQRLVDPRRERYWPRVTPGPAFFAHALAVSELYVGLQLTAPATLITFDTEPVCWRRFAGPHGARLTLKPDAYVVVAAGEYEDHYFIEIDRGTESLPRIDAKLRYYVRYWTSGREQAASGVFPRVVWLAPDDRRVEQLCNAVGALGPTERALFDVRLAANAVACMTCVGSA